MKTRTRLSETVAIAALLATFVSVNAQAHPATPVVEALHDSFIESMQNAESLGYAGRYEKLHAAIAQAYDLDFMAKKVVGRQWNDLTAEQQKQWFELFCNLTVANYAGRFEGHTGESFLTVGDTAAPNDTVVVQTQLLIPDGDPISFNYRLRGDESGWRIIDVYMNGTVSELALRRSDYSSMLKREGFDELTAAVTKKIAELEGGSSDRVAAK